MPLLLGRWALSRARASGSRVQRSWKAGTACGAFKGLLRPPSNTRLHTHHNKPDSQAPHFFRFSRFAFCALSPGTVPDSGLFTRYVTLGNKIGLRNLGK
jgi:hypothetical protein